MLRVRTMAGLAALAWALAAAGTGAAGPGLTGDWRGLGHRPEAIYGWNNSSVVPSRGGVDVTFLTVWGISQGEIDYETQNIRFECAARTYRVPDRQSYRMDGSPVETQATALEDLTFEANSPHGLLFSLTCGDRVRPPQASPSELRDFAEASRLHLTNGAADRP